MERADIGLTGNVRQIDRLLRMRIDPQRRLDGAAAIPLRGRGTLMRSPRNHFDKTAGEDLPDLVEADIAAAVSGSLRKFAQHHQFRQRRHRADLPDVRAVADRLHQFGIYEKRQALVSADMIMGTHEFVAGMADQDRSRHQLEETATAVAAKTAFADIVDRMAGVLLHERLVARRGAAPEL